MSTATLTLAESVREAHAACHLAMERPDQAELTAEIIGVVLALEVYEALDSRALSWEAEWPALSGEAAPDGAALAKAAEAAAIAGGALIAAMAAKDGRKANDTNETSGVATWL